jgi:hypothetical protein
MTFTVRTLNIFVTPDGKIIGAGPKSLVGIPGFIDYTDAPVNYRVSTPQIIPIQSEPAQILNVILNEQDCAIQLYFKEMYTTIDESIFQEPPVYDKVLALFLDLYVNNTIALGGALCQANNTIIKDTYLGFAGDLGIVDTQPPTGIGPQPPAIAGLGTRWLLTYWPDLNQ